MSFGFGFGFGLGPRGRAGTGTGGGTPVDPDAAAYFAGVTAAGSSLSPAQKAALNKYVAQLKADGNWTQLEDHAVFAGASSLNGVLVKLKARAGSPAALANTGFSAAHYDSVQGLIGGAGRYLDAGISIPTLLPTDFCWGAFLPGVSTGITMPLGASYAASGDSDRFYLATGTAFSPHFGAGNMYSGPAQVDQTPPCLLAATLTPYWLRTYRNGALVNEGGYWNNQGMQPGTVRVCGTGAIAGPNGRQSAYFVARASLNQTTFAAALNTLMADLGAPSY